MSSGRPALVNARTPVEAPEVWIRLVGELAARRGSRRFGATEIGSRKARTLLALLAVEGGRVVGADRLVHVLWGDRPPRRPVENVAVLVSRLRAALGADAILGGRTGYRLGPSVTVDLFEAARLVTTAEARLAVASHGQALPLARCALDLLGAGQVLQDQPSAEWADGARMSHGSLLRRARHATAAAALHKGDVWTSRAVAEAAVAADATDEIAARILMRAHDMAGEPVRALNAYRRLRATLVEELGIDPAPSTRRLHLAILQGGRARTPA